MVKLLSYPSQQVIYPFAGLYFVMVAKRTLTGNGFNIILTDEIRNANQKHFSQWVELNGGQNLLILSNATSLTCQS